MDWLCHSTWMYSAAASKQDEGWLMTKWLSYLPLDRPVASGPLLLIGVVRGVIHLWASSLRIVEVARLLRSPQSVAETECRRCMLKSEVEAVTHSPALSLSALQVNSCSPTPVWCWFDWMDVSSWNSISGRRLMQETADVHIMVYVSNRNPTLFVLHEHVVAAWWELFTTSKGD